MAKDVIREYEKLDDVRKILTEQIEDLTDELAEEKTAKRKDKKRIAELEGELARCEKLLSETLSQLDALEKKYILEKKKTMRDTPKDIPKMLYNEVIAIEGVYALVLRADGTLGYLIIQEGFCDIGDFIPDSRLRDIAELDGEIKEKLCVEVL